MKTTAALRFLCAFLAALLVAAGAYAQSPVATAAPTHLQFLWEVSSLTNRIYLYGTVHSGKLGWYPLNREVEDAFESAQVLVVEADITDRAAMEKSSVAMTYVPPDSLSRHVSEVDYVRFRKQLPRFQLPEPAVALMKPFMAVSLLVFSEWARLGYLPEYGVDAYLIGKARAGKKKVEELEGVKVQMDLMDSLTDQENRTIFSSTLGALESGLTDEQITGMVNAWQSGDAKLMLEIAQKYNDTVPGAREFEEKFVWGRHEAMLAKIEGYLNNSHERRFVALGALHLAGSRGLVEALRRKGYVVKQR